VTLHIQYAMYAKSPTITHRIKYIRQVYVLRKPKGVYHKKCYVWIII